MKFRGKRLSSNFRRSVSLPRPDGSQWEMEIKPLRLSFHRSLRERGIEPPSPPRKVCRDAQGRALRDAEGLAVLQRDEADRDYQLALERYHQRVATLIVWECLNGDMRYEFESPVPNSKEGWPEFADQLHVELENSGWSSGDVIWFCEQVAELSHLAGDHSQESYQRFF